MKKHTKGITFYTSGRSDFEYSEDAAAGTCEVMENLRNDGSALRPVGNIEAFASLAQGERLLAAHRTAGGVNIISCIGRKMIWHSTIADDGKVTARNTLIGYASGYVDCAQALGNFVHIGCDGGDAVIHYNGSAYLLLNRNDAMPELRLTTTDTSVVGADVAAMDFAGHYTRWNSPLLPDDVSKLTAIMQGAVKRIEEEAAADESYIYPVVARYAVRMTDGSYLHISAPVVIGCGIPFSAEYRTPAVDDGETFTGIEGFRVTAPSFRIGVEALRAIPQEWDNLIAGIDVLVADATTPLFRTGSIGYRCETTTATHQAILMLRYGNMGAGELVRRLIAQTHWKVSYTITDFNALREGTAVLRTADGEVPAAVVEACEAAMPLCYCSKAGIQHNRRLFLAPDKALMQSQWGALSVLKVDRSVATTYDAVLVARLSTAHGEAVTVWRGGGTGKPTGVNPLLSYPDARAYRLELMVCVGGRVSECSAELHSHGTTAYSVADNLELRTLTATAATSLNQPEAVNTADDFTGRVLESREMNVFVARAVHSVCDSRIIALSDDMHRSNNSIGTPVYAFAASGVYALPYRVVSSSYSPGVIVTRRCIAAGTQPVNTASRLVFVTAQGELCRINQYKVDSVVRHLGAVKALGYHAGRNEVWLHRSDGMVAVVDSRSRVYVRTRIFNVMYAFEEVGVLLVTATRTLCNAAHEKAQFGEIKLLTAPFSPEPDSDFIPIAVTIDLAADLFQGTVTIYGERGHSCHGMQLCRATINGEVAKPLHFRFRAPALRTMRIGIEGKVSADAVFGRFRVDFHC